MTQALNAEFPNGEVGIYAVNWREDANAIEGFVQDVGLRVPVLHDRSTTDSSCRHIPEGAEDLTTLYQAKVRDSARDPPFPIHVVIDAKGRYAYLRRNSDLQALIAVLKQLVAEGSGQ